LSPAEGAYSTSQTSSRLKRGGKEGDRRGKGCI